MTTYIRFLRPRRRLIKVDNQLTKENKKATMLRTKHKFSDYDPVSFWRGLQDITNYRRPFPHLLRETKRWQTA